ncbi:hypothetical protein [Actinomadura vinacea]|uniref:hypothetical protein n=1 Tax=Actinomadura vinacea TaxID=115336 RepID=UPI0031D06A8C
MSTSSRPRGTASTAWSDGSPNASVTPVPRTAEELLVILTDAKGIVMRVRGQRIM